MKGTLFIISAPSGAGKTSLVKALIDSLSNIVVSVSHTTRSIRPGETEGLNYHFVSHEAFESMVKNGDFLEHAEIYGNRYGTSRKWVEETLAGGKDVILEIEWRGAQQVRDAFSDAISVYILPPSKKALEERLKNRDQDEPHIIEKRLSMAGKEVKFHEDYDYLVLNDQFEVALSDLRSIVRAEHCQQSHQAKRLKALIDDLSR